MKKLITLANIKTGIIESMITGEVRKINASEDERIELLAKNIAELHNAGVEKLLREEEEKRKAEIISNSISDIQIHKIKGLWNKFLEKLKINKG